MGGWLPRRRKSALPRVKYWAGFPVQAIRYVLSEAGIQPQDLDHIGIARNPSANLMKKVLYTLRRRPSLNLIKDRLANAGKVGDLKGIFCERMGLDPLSLKAQFHNVEHHRAHMASAFFVSPFREAAILSVDGMGDFVSTMWGVGKDNTFEVSDAVNFPHSLGYLYTAISQWLGFPKYGDEGKVMGLAPYGAPRYLDEFRRIVRIQRDGSFELDLDYFELSGKGALMTWEDDEPSVPTMFSAKLVRSARRATRPAHGDHLPARGRGSQPAGHAGGGRVCPGKQAAEGDRADGPLHGRRRGAQQRLQRQDPAPNQVRGDLYPAGGR